MKKILTLILSLFFIPPVFAGLYDKEEPLNNISKKIPALNNISCKFRQEKQTSNIVLKLSGDFVFDKSKGVTFYTTYPIKSTTSYSTREYRQINNVITAISNKSYSRLEKDFKFYFQKENDIWTLALMPKQTSQAYNYLKTIEITGGAEKINKIMILTCDKTRTTIWFI